MVKKLPMSPQLLAKLQEQLAIPVRHAQARRATEDKAQVQEALDEMARPMAVCITCNRDVIIEEMYDEITCIECHG